LQQTIEADAWPTERRRFPRVFLGLPVRVHLAGEAGPVTIELADISAGGGYFRTAERRPCLDQRVAFGFVVADALVCAARGRVVRVDAQGFALSLECANTAYRNFVNDISGALICAA
jgi:hypothetical protein